MSRSKKIVLVGLAMVLLLALAAGLLFWRYPLGVSAWLSRQGLRGAGFSRVEVETSAGKQIVWEAGSGPLIVFLHGAGDQAGAWVRVAPEFAADHRVLVVDLAGHGDSEPKEGSLPLPLLLSAFSQVMEQRVDGKAVLVGNSLGAWLSFLYAREQPEKVSRIVAVNGGPLRSDLGGYSLMPQTRKEARDLFDALFYRSAEQVPGFILDDVIRQANSGAIPRLVADVRAMEEHVLDGKLEDFPVPADLIWGDADLLMDMNYAQRLKEALPAARLTVIPQCGHVPQRECPQDFSRRLRDALSQPPPSVPDLIPPQAEAPSSEGAR